MLSGRQLTGLVLGPALFACTLLMAPPEGMSVEAWRTAGIGAMMATLWIGESVPFAVTALLPLVIFPLAGVTSMQEAASPFANPIIFLFLGGIFIALGMERWGLHRRIALAILARVGDRPPAIVGGFLIASGFLSMWINNTATAVMMLPIGLSVVALLGECGKLRAGGFAPALMLAIAYGANIGGFTTLIGTAPNALFAGYAREELGVDVGFLNWMLFALPVGLVVGGGTWFALTRIAFRLPRDPVVGAAEKLLAEGRDLGPMRGGERVVAVVFALTAAAWLARPVLPWPSLTDTGIAMAGGLSLFFLPAGHPRNGAVLDWETAKKIPWDVLLLIGGGLSLAGAVQSTGLAEWIAGEVGAFGGLRGIWLIVVFSAVTLCLTELTSNTATTATFLPILGALALGLGENPVLLTACVAIAASGAFLLPVATPPNAIVFAGGLVSVPQMVRAGIWSNLLMLAALTAMAALFGKTLFGME